MKKKEETYSRTNNCPGIYECIEYPEQLSVYKRWICNWLY